ncbi:hypothetical protein ACJIZ3_023469 [Penstemon smallii]|uniref:Myb/SANT-like domain-containing protein n=1 Tax=Penstemon smallii TaxID=265156 RepID=A0ABD3TS28_9LAMI
MAMAIGDWRAQDEKVYVEMLLEAAMNNEIVWGMNNKDAFIAMSVKLTQQTNRMYTYTKVLRKYRELYIRYHTWEEVRSISGLGFDAQLNRIIANDDIWAAISQGFNGAMEFNEEEDEDDAIENVGALFGALVEVEDVVAGPIGVQQLFPQSWWNRRLLQLGWMMWLLQSGEL